ncbi:MAG: sigma-E processing peptidase SpoIIGA [Cellulosilyticaceae bacterium]
MQVIYIDILFALNFLMDLFIFRIAALLINKKVRGRQLIVASLLAATTYCLSIGIPCLRQFPVWFNSLMIPVLAILYLFRPSTIKGFLKVYTLCLVSAWIIGGIGFNFYYGLSRLSGGKVSIWLPVIGGACVWLLVEGGIIWLRKQKIHLQYSYDLQIVHQGKNMAIKGFLDTGNHLYTMCHKPVMLMNKDVVWQLFSKEESDFLKSCMEKGIEHLLQDSEKMPKLKIYLIPYESVGCKEGMLIGVKLQQLTLKRGDYIKQLEECVVGIAPHQLFKEDHYHVLIHPECVA